MIKINLLIEEDYIEEFMNNLPKDKVKVIETNFETNKQLLNDIFKECMDASNELIPYSQSIKNISEWLQVKES